MLRVRVVCVGKLKDKFFSDAQLHYTKMLSRLCAVDVIEVKDETPRDASAAGEAAAREAEGERIMAQLQGYVIACDPAGKMRTSEQFAELLDELPNGGVSTVTFVIGGSTGLSEQVRGRADLKLSLSPMVIAHRLFRIVLLEQIYRAMKISRGETYHK